MPKQNKRKVFITGAGGFVGANLVRRLLKENYSVHVLNHHAEIPWRLKEVSHQIIIHRGSITSYSTLYRLLKKMQPEYILHLAVYGAYHYQTDLKKIVKVNIQGTENLLRATQSIPYRCFINTGTSSEYGFKKKAMKETNSCNPTSYYAATKLASTQLCKVFAQNEGKPIVTFRLFSVYGPFEAHTRLVPAIMNNLIGNTPIHLSSDDLKHDFIYIDDVCSAYLQAMKLGAKLTGEIINIGTGIEYTNKEIVEHTFNITKKMTHVEIGTYQKRTWDSKHWRADITRMNTILQFNPVFSIDKGLQKTYSWFVKNRALYQPFYEKK